MSARSFWIRFQTCVQQKPSGFFVVTWMPSHIREKHPQLLEDGIFIEKEVDWNDSADELASKALDGKLLKIETVSLTRSRHRFASKNRKFMPL